MNPTIIACYPPVAHKDHLDRLAALPPRPDMASDLWTEVHEETQRNLVPLDIDVRNRLGEVQVRSGHTKGTAFSLFTYRTYSLPDSAFDPVVVGITFKPAPGGVALEADVSGEEIGDVILSLPSQVVPESKEELIRAVRALARELCQSSADLAAALGNPSRHVE